ncbi:MAG: H-type lectin domain-containing protein [Bacteroidota bacterium]
MKKQLFSSKGSLCTISIYILLFLISTSSFSQLAPPQGINYQAIARDTTGKAISSQNLDVKFSIWATPTGGTVPLFTETHPSVPTNKYGLFTLVIGSQIPNNFASIPWAIGDKYLEVEIAAAGGSFYSIGRNQMMSVPYALYSGNSENSWNLNGNVIFDTLFIGTRNAKDFVVKTNSLERIRVTSDGQTGIGTATPGSFLDVKDSTDLLNGVPVATIRNMAASNGSILELTAAPGGDPATHDKLTGLIINAPTGRFIQGFANSTKVFEVGVGGKGYFGDSVGIGTTTPGAMLDVNGQIKISGGSPGAGKVLTSDANGLATWGSAINGVSSFSSADLSPLFTTVTVNSTTTPALSFNLSNAGAYTVFGNNTNASAAPAYFSPLLASPLFQNQGTSAQVLHGNTSGSPTWGSVSLTSDVSGILPLANGGTNAALAPINGGIVYTDASGMAVSTAGTARQVLRSNGAAAPTWAYTVDTVKGSNGVVSSMTNTSGITYTVSGVNNSAVSPGVVSAAGLSQANKVWKVDAVGNPGWRVDSSAAYTGGTGISIAPGNTINSVWTEAGNDIYNNNSDSVGIGTALPEAKLHVMSTGVMGDAGKFEITDPNNPDKALVVSTDGSGSAGLFYITDVSNTSDALSVITDGDGDAVSAETTGDGAAGVFINSNISNTDNALYVETNGTDDALYAITYGAGSAGEFEINSPTNSSPAVNGLTDGTGPAGMFKISSILNPSAAIIGETGGIGAAGSFTNTNVVSSADVVNISAFGSNSKGLSITHFGSGNSTDYGIIVSNLGAGNNNTAGSFLASGAITNVAGVFSASTSGATTNIGGRFAASGGTNNYAAIFEAGNVGIGLTAPSALSSLHTAGQIQTGIPLGGLGGALATDGSVLFHNVANAQTATIKSDSTTTSYTLYLPKAQASSQSLLLNDGLGGLSWLNTSVLSAWGLTGNINTIPSNVAIGTSIPLAQNYVGTADSKAFVMGTDSKERMRITATGNIGIGTLTATNILSFGSGATRKIWIENSASGIVGRDLTVAAGSTSGGTDIPGGSQIIQAGLGTGTGASTISFQNGTTLASGTTLQTMSTKMTILGNGNVGIGTLTPSANSRLAIKDGHLQSQQSIVPLLSASGTSAQSLSNANDVAGNISFTPNVSVSGSVTITFSKTYTTAPIVLITPTNGNSANDISKVYVSTTTFGFTINFTPTFDTSAHTFSYFVIETQ